jgi:hypothetical protein
MSKFIIIVDDKVGASWPTLKEATDWVDAGNCDYAETDIVIAKVIQQKSRNTPTPPTQRFTGWRQPR